MSHQEPKVWSLVTRTARKPHVCDECRCVIEPGDQYEDVDTLQEGGWSKYRTCLSCREWSHLVRRWTLGALHEALSETYRQHDGWIEAHHCDCAQPLRPQPLWPTERIGCARCGGFVGDASE